MSQYIVALAIIILLGALYEKYSMKYDDDEELSRYEKVKQFLLNSASSLSGKPLLWIHCSHKVNSRWWPSFYSRNTMRLNQPFLLSCIETVIKKCSKSFNICLIDDDSFAKLLPGWSVDIQQLAAPVQDHIRALATAKLLYYYGGLLLPPSVIVMENLHDTYKQNLVTTDCFSANMVSQNSTSTYVNTFPNHRVLGCKKHSPTVKRYIAYLERLVSEDYTDQIAFLGEFDRWLYQESEKGTVGLLEPKVLGAVDALGNLVTVDQLMGDTFLPFGPETKAIYVPAAEILKRTQFQWFARLSQEQLRHCNNMVAKYLLVAQHE